MTEVGYEEGREISLFALGNIILRKRWRIFGWVAAGALLATVTGLLKQPTYVATTSFVPQGNDASRSGLASLAGQLGLAVPNGNESFSPDFYAKLITSRVLLTPITRDSLTVPESGKSRVSMQDLLGIKPGPAAQREDETVARLRSMVSVTVNKGVGVVEVGVTTRWRSVSLAIATSIMKGIGEYNARVRQSQATAERKFAEGRLAVAATDLRASEDRLINFQATNRNIGNSPELMQERERIQRDLSMRQQLFLSLTESVEGARIREVRDTPVITPFEAPWAPTHPESRGMVKRTMLGLLFGGFAGIFAVFASGMIASRREHGDVDAGEFAGTLGEVRSEILHPIRHIRARIRE